MPTQPSMKWALATLSPGVTRPGREADYSPPSSADVKYCGAIPSLPHPSSWPVAWLVKHRNNFIYIVQCSGFLIASTHQLYRVMPLKTPFGLLLPLLQSQSHVTTFTHNYFLRCYTCTQLTITYTFVTTVTFSTLALANFSAINFYLKLSHTLHLHTLKLSPRSHSANSPFKTP
jgi:hypothetical protein